MSHGLRKSSAEKRAEKEIINHGQQCRYARMEREGARDTAEKQFRHKPYGRME